LKTIKINARLRVFRLFRFEKIAWNALGY